MVTSEGKRGRKQEEAIFLSELCNVVMCPNQNNEYRQDLQAYYMAALDEREKHFIPQKGGKPVMKAEAPETGKQMMALATQFMRLKGLMPHDVAKGLNG
jgi:hypothetical protein